MRIQRELSATAKTASSIVFSCKCIMLGLVSVDAAKRCRMLRCPNMCTASALSGVWDDRHSNLADDFGGHCTSIAEATAVNHDPSVELLNITLTHDDRLTGFYNGVQPKTSILCMRPSQNFRFMMIPPFKAACAEDIDLPLLEEYRQSKGFLTWVRALASGLLLQSADRTWQARCPGAGSWS